MTESKAVPKKKFGGPQEGSGRPRKDLDESLLIKLGSACLTDQSIATILDCSVEHLRHRYLPILQQAREGKKRRLVEAMWSKALEEKDCKMQIWLSKQHLGYKENATVEAHSTVFNVTCVEVPK